MPCCRIRVHHDPSVYIFWLIHSMYIERFIVNTLIGGVVAVVAKGREMAATIALALLGDVLAIEAMLMAVARTGDHGFCGRCHGRSHSPSPSLWGERSSERGDCRRSNRDA